MDQIPKDVIALALSLVYVGAAVGTGELVRRRKGYGDEFTRKIVHVSVGVWIIPTLFLYTKWYWAAILPAAAVIGNTLSMKYNLLPGIERGDKKDFGTVLFPISFIICLERFFEGRHNGVAAAVGIMIMALGDASAAIFGKAYGKHPYTLLGAKKSVEGSAAMLVVSVVAAFVTLVSFGVEPRISLIAAVATGAVATVLEAAGKDGLDNFTVPVICSIVTHYLLVVLEGVE